MDFSNDEITQRLDRLEKIVSEILRGDLERDLKASMTSQNILNTRNTMLDELNRRNNQ